ncbi:Uncharacterized protein dnm_022190 [Desulfonema magnum]|uniref:Uncharacterized protein n=1 Tax=Desulfonema magnum TaxID=45655 RepID=A0A975BIY2_9BACT|nr:Uncharacterized protein dnm_022190 [Desulfonema magnum]
MILTNLNHSVRGDPENIPNGVAYPVRLKKTVRLKKKN